MLDVIDFGFTPKEELMICRERRIHSPPNGKSKIIDSRVPAGIKKKLTLLCRNPARRGLDPSDRYVMQIKTSNSQI